MLRALTRQHALQSVIRRLAKIITRRKFLLLFHVTLLFCVQPYMPGNSTFSASDLKFSMSLIQLIRMINFRLIFGA